jgi:hypothetical protein
MQVQFIRNTMTSQGNARMGVVLDLPDNEVKTLMGLGRCIPHDAVVEIEDRSVGLETSDAEPVIRRGRPKKVK